MFMQSVLQEVSEKFFTLLGVDFDAVEVITQDEEKDIYMVKIKTSDSAILIGPHGRTLEELQSLLQQVAEGEMEKRILIHLEINDYLEEKDRRLYDIVEKKIADVMRTGIGESFHDLNGYERKKVHAYVSDKHIAGLETHSETDEEGKRTLHISFSGDVDVSESIDLDGVDI